MLGLGLGLNKGVPLALYKILARTCGLLSYSDKVYSGIMYDKTGQTRDAVLAKSLDGDGSMYYDTGIVPNQTTALRVWGNFNSLVSSLHGERSNDSNSDFDFGLLGNQWRADWGNNIILVSGVADINKHKFEISNGEFFIDDVKVGGTFGADIGNPTDSIFLQALNNNGLSDLECNFTLDRCEIDHNGKTYTLDIPGLSSDIIQLVNLDDSSDFIQGTLMLPSATPTSFTDKVVSIEDMYGYSISKALGKNLFDDTVITTAQRLDTTSGNLISNASFNTGDFILVNKNTNYVVSDGAGLGFVYWCRYDENKNYISGGTSLTLNSLEASFIRISVQSADLEPQLELGSTPTTYEPYEGYYRDSLLTEPYPQGAIIPCDKRGISFSFVSDGQGGSLQPRADFVGKIANNFVKCDSDGTINPSGLYVKNDQVYGHITSTDANETLWDKTLQEVKTVLFENINYHNQFFINADETRISYYDSELTEPCLTKALSLMKL